ncbi:MAG: HXXEE domain-containing protein [Clostridiaceae bacterium]|nr:HXXEE domain-containing protein [Clostridiaceae bacterium]
MYSLLATLDVKAWLWIIPAIFFFHEMEEWNILKWYHSTFNPPPKSTLLSTRLWLFFISIVVCVLSSLAYVIPVKIISMLIVLFLITFTGFNAPQHIYWFFAFKKYAPGVIFSSIGLAVDLILTIAILVQGLVNPIIVAAFAIATVPMLVETFRAKNKSTKAFESMHEFTLKMVAFLEK